MARLEILRFPDKRLRTKATPVEQVDDRIRQLLDDMRETMYDDDGIGLAATQVNVHERVIVIDVSKTRDEPLYLINPEILEQDGNAVSDEGCLSVPGFYEPVERAEKITVRALNRDGETFVLDAEGTLAVCIQHEMDHLIGKLFVDYISPLKRNRIKDKLEKQRKQNKKQSAKAA
ncbi:MAG: peptide deformylase [Pseudomonadota bacterium]